MTCGVTVIDKSRRVWIGADSMISSGWDALPSIASKVFEKGHYLIATSGDSRFRQLLQYEINYPEPTGDLNKFMATIFIAAIRAATKQAGYTTIDKNRESIDSTAIIGVRGGYLYTLYSDYCILPATYGFTSIGCARSEALAILFDSQDLEPEERIERALKAAEFCSAAVRRHFVTKCLEPLTCTEKTEWPERKKDE
jgi:hypothetical protein